MKNYWSWHEASLCVANVDKNNIHVSYTDTKFSIPSLHISDLLIFQFLGYCRSWNQVL